MEGEIAPGGVGGGGEAVFTKIFNKRIFIKFFKIVLIIFCNFGFEKNLVLHNMFSSHNLKYIFFLFYLSIYFIF